MSCKELNSTSTAFHLRDCSKLLKDKDNEGDESETCEELLTRVKSSQDKMQNPRGYGKGKGKQKSGKTVPSANIVKAKVGS